MYFFYFFYLKFFCKHVFFDSSNLLWNPLFNFLFIFFFASVNMFSLTHPSFGIHNIVCIFFYFFLFKFFCKHVFFDSSNLLWNPLFYFLFFFCKCKHVFFDSSKLWNPQYCMYIFLFFFYLKFFCKHVFFDSSNLLW